MILQGIETGLFEKTEPFLSEDKSHITNSMNELVWEKLDSAVFKVLQSTTLKELVETSLKKINNNASMFYI